LDFRSGRVKLSDSILRVEERKLARNSEKGGGRSVQDSEEGESSEGGEEGIRLANEKVVFPQARRLRVKPRVTKTGTQFSAQNK